LPPAAASLKGSKRAETELISPPVLSPQSSIAEDNIKTSKAAPRTPFELLLAFCRSETGAKRSLQNQLGRETVPDLQVLIRLAEQHDVVPVLHREVFNFPDAVPSQVLEALRLAYQRNAQKNVRLTHELIRIIDCLESHAVAAIPYKGPVLAQVIYGEIAMRQFSDLDILIRPADVPRAKAAVAALGYRPSWQMTDAEEQAYVCSGYERAFDGPLGGNLLELQWRILPRFYCVDLSVECLFERASEIDMGGRMVRALSPEDLVLILCIHGAKHAWSRLSLLCDIAGAARSRNINYELLEERAHRLGIARIVGVNFWLVHDLLGLPSPPPLAKCMQRDRNIEFLARRIQRRLSHASEYDPQSSDYFRLMLALRERTSDRVRFLARLAFTPSMGEWATLRLPSWLFPIYRMIRLYRLAGRLFRSVGQQLRVWSVR
jgi:Uncharacterised nucleotidyltransferase